MTSFECAHLGPQAFGECFLEQDMRRYNINSSFFGDKVLDDHADCLTLRLDLHQALDKNHFFFARKQDSWAAHFLTAAVLLGAELHNRIVDIPAIVHHAFILTRIATAVVSRRESYMRQATRPVWITCGDRTVIRLVTRRKSEAYFDGKKKDSSRSPKKRKQDQDSAADDEDVLPNRKKYRRSSTASITDLEHIPADSRISSAHEYYRLRTRSHISHDAALE